jgi:hypothetical protein
MNLETRISRSRRVNLPISFCGIPWVLASDICYL